MTWSLMAKRQKLMDQIDRLDRDLEVVEAEIAKRELEKERRERLDRMEARAVLRTWRMTRNDSETARRHGISRYRAKELRLKAVQEEKDNR